MINDKKIIFDLLWFHEFPILTNTLIFIDCFDEKNRNKLTNKTCSDCLRKSKNLGICENSELRIRETMLLLWNELFNSYVPSYRLRNFI